MSHVVSEEHKREVKRAAQARYREAHREQIAEYQRKARVDNGRAWDHAYYDKHRDRLLEESRSKQPGRRAYQREWARTNRVPLRVADPVAYAKYLENKTVRLKQAGAALAERRKKYTPETKRLRNRLRNSIYWALKRVSARKCAETFELLGMSVAAFRNYIEGLFVPGMSWSNYGEWELDHKRPVASFDLTAENQQRECFHYSNYQPLWKIDNRRKGAKFRVRL